MTKHNFETDINTWKKVKILAIKLGLTTEQAVDYILTKFFKNKEEYNNVLKEESKDG